ncbi:MAG TPA: hypothetical protein VM100_12410 [Longimicrobiales bacterium]|nr:hypothetical protein [Longimicrobiales bacterium]
MHDILRDRLWRKLEALEDAQIYQVLDYIEFLESKYAPGQGLKPDPLTKFAERFEDSMRMRSVAPKVILGTVGLMGTARKVVRGVTDAGKDLLGALEGDEAKQRGNEETKKRANEETRERKNEEPK